MMWDVAAAAVGAVVMLVVLRMDRARRGLRLVDPKLVRRVQDCAESWKAEAERQKLDAVRWRKRALRRGWRWGR